MLQSPCLTSLFRLSVLFTYYVLFGSIVSCNVQPSDQTEPRENIKIYIVGDKTAYDEISPYGQMGTYLKRQLDRCGKFNVEVAPTNGSLHTLISMDEEDSASIGIVQSDVLFHYFNGNHPQFPSRKSTSQIRAFCKLFREHLNISITGNLDSICSLNDTAFQLYRNKDVLSFPYARINGGSTASGSLVTTLNVARILTRPWENKDHSLSKMGTGSDLNVVRPTLNLEVKSPTSINGNNKEFLIGLSEQEAKVISSAFPKAYKRVQYENFPELNNCFIEKLHRNTVSVDAVLIVHKTASEALVDTVSAIIKRIEDSINKVKVEDRVSGKVYLEKYADGRYKKLPIGKHHELLKNDVPDTSFWLATIVSSEVLVWILIILGSILFIRAFIPVWNEVRHYEKIGSFRKTGIALWKMKKFYLIVAGVIIYHLIIAILIWVSEYHYSKEYLVNNEEFISIGVVSSIKWVFAYVTANQSNIDLYSTMAMVWVGILEASYAITSTAAAVIWTGRFIKYVKTKQMNNHIVIIGWNNLGNRLLNELRAMNETTSPKPVDVKIIGSVPLEQTKINHDFEDDYKMRSNRNDNLEEVNCHAAQAVIILADPSWAKMEEIDSADLWVIRTLSHVIKYFEEHNHKRPRIIVEINDPENMQFAKGADEIICVKYLGYQLLVQSAARPGLSKIFSQLLNTNTQDNEVYYFKINQDIFNGQKENSDKLLPIRYIDAVNQLRAKGDLIGKTAIGIRNPKALIEKIVHTEQQLEEIELNPADEQLIYPGSELIVIAKFIKQSS